MKDNPEAAQQWKNIMTDLMQDWKIMSVVTQRWVQPDHGFCWWFCRMPPWSLSGSTWGPLLLSSATRRKFQVSLFHPNSGGCKVLTPNASRVTRNSYGGDITTISNPYIEPYSNT
jgi:hypothetical protein